MFFHVSERVWGVIVELQPFCVLFPAQAASVISVDMIFKDLL